jgi:hypothetical protein
MYSAFLVDQTLALNRRCDDTGDIKTEVRCSYSTIETIDKN